MSATKTVDITPQSIMGDILEAFPSAKRALFQRYHVGGCSSCGYAPTDKLEDVLKSHNVLDVQGAIEFIKESAEQDAKIQVSVQDVSAGLKNGNNLKLIDVREPFEREIAKIEPSQLLSRDLAMEIMNSWQKDANIVFYCHEGMRSLDAASYFAGHGFTNAKSMTGGIDAWSSEVDSSVPRY